MEGHEDEGPRRAKKGGFELQAGTEKPIKAVYPETERTASDEFLTVDRFYGKEAKHFCV